MLCKHCKAPFINKGTNQIYCTNNCKQSFYWENNKSGTEKERLRSKDKYTRLGKTPRWRYNYYRAHARKANRDFTISLEYFTRLINQKCFYCGRQNLQMGIDRINNSLGYILNNVRTACQRCNMAKGKMAEEDFYEMCRLVTKLH